MHAVVLSLAVGVTGLLSITSAGAAIEAGLPTILAWTLSLTIPGGAYLGARVWLRRLVRKRIRILSALLDRITQQVTGAEEGDPERIAPPVSAPGRGHTS